MEHARHPAVAGAFYPADPEELRDSVDRLLARASAPLGALPKAVIVPHAGYSASGPVAASAYACLREARGRITRVVLLGPCHRILVEGIAVPDVEVLTTPLGQIPIDVEAIRSVEHLVIREPRAHASEHSIEVQLPFLQRTLGEGFKVVPLAVGEVEAEAVAHLLDALWGGPETLVVVSSDLSHYLPYAVARGVDRFTAQRVLELSPALDSSEACGATPLNGLLIQARRKQLHPEVVDLRSSGDTAGAREGVVGYGAFCFYEVRGVDGRK